GALNLLADRINLTDLRVVATTPWYPGWVFSARAGLDPQNPEDRKILEAADLTGIVAAQDRDFDSVRELAERLDLAQRP
ncbi:MAG: phosphonate ABC transporter substrate-binding protein, partial [Desulfobacterales bacterium]